MFDGGKDGNEMKHYKTAIFDLDGTLLNTLEDLTNSVNAALEKNNKPQRTIEEVRSFVGNGIRLLVERAVPAGTAAAETDQIFADFKAHYAIHCNDKTRPYDGMPALLEKLSKEGYHLAIVSNKADSAVKELNQIYFKDVISVAIGECEGIRKKPAPDTVNQAFRELGVTKEDAVYIGDSDVDVMTAKNSGLPCISVLWGFREKEFLKENGATVFAKDADELEQLL